MKDSRVETLARAARRLGSRRRQGKGWPTLLFFTDPLRTPDPAIIMSRLPRGTGVVFRAFGATTAVTEGRRLVRIARRHRLIFFVGADCRLAALLGADGVHLPQREAGRKGRNLQLRRRFRLSAAVHDEPALRRARHAGIEAMVISPIFPSRSPSAGRPKGPRAFARLARLAGSHAYALGGVSLLTIKRLNGTGAAGVAAIGAFDEAGVPIARRAKT